MRLKTPKAIRDPSAAEESSADRYCKSLAVLVNCWATDVKTDLIVQDSLGHDEAP